MTRPTWEVADILRHTCSDHFLKTLHPHLRKVAHDIMHCRTAALGGHQLACSKCGHVENAYNSCRNRHCPKCQWSRQIKWIDQQERLFIPVRYAHVVFTLPAQLNQLAMHQPRTIYNALFTAAWNTVRSLAQDPRWIGATPAMIAVLHTWGQNLSLHPHLHCLIPLGGWCPELRRWIWPTKKRFLFPVKVMSKRFRGQFISKLDHQVAKQPMLQHKWSTLKMELRNASFNVFTQISYGCARRVIKYLGRYSSRVAISNRRILTVSKNRVSFKYKDYRDGRHKITSVSTSEFTRRFLMHVLPKGFQKIRYYGFLAHRHREKMVADILFFFNRRMPKPEKTAKTLVTQPIKQPSFGICPKCDQGELLRSSPLPRARSPGP